MKGRAAAGLALAAGLAGQVLAADDPALFPAAQCAALWFGQADYAVVSPYLDSDPEDLELARAFRQVALRQTTQGPAAIDAFIAAQRRQPGIFRNGGCGRGQSLGWLWCRGSKGLRCTPAKVPPGPLPPGNAGDLSGQ
ncbi:MAG: hypothetical protein LW715_04160 [Rhodobacter sp.]|nr:hypothetical protein [Rhodobacter sp.]